MHGMECIIATMLKYSDKGIYMYTHNCLTPFGSCHCWSKILLLVARVSTPLLCQCLFPCMYCAVRVIINTPPCIGECELYTSSYMTLHEMHG